jgi:hypothetical protein
LIRINKLPSHFDDFQAKELEKSLVTKFIGEKTGLIAVRRYFKGNKEKKDGNNFIIIYFEEGGKLQK